MYMKRKMGKHSIIFAIYLVLNSVSAVSQKHTDVIIVGGLGNLAKKYLWQGMFKLFYKYSNENTTFSFYGCGRSVKEEGNEMLDTIVKTQVTCTQKDCDEKKESFFKIVEYFPLKNEDDFTNFGKHLNRNLKNSEDNGRIFYFALPPNTYVSMAKKMKDCCYVKEDGWNRLVLEKPFGSDKETATRMSEDIGNIYEEKEIYRVDHYLGKSVVKQILPFRESNKDRLEQLLNRNHVMRVEVAMKENFGVKGRIDFYDQYGVVLDVLQNHLTELLCLVAMDMPTNITNSQEVDERRIKLLKQVKPVSEEAVLTGQYAEYLKQAAEEKDNVTLSRHTPTFAAALLEIHNARWLGVPFVLVSGKHLDEKSSFIRIIFKDNNFCIAGCHHHNDSHWGGTKQIIFQISHGNLPSAGILVSKDLFMPKLSPGLKELAISADNTAIYGQSLNDFYFAIPVENSDAYVSVINDLYNERRESFVGTQRLMHLWDIWSPVANKLRMTLPKLYNEKQDMSLNFKMNPRGLEYLYKTTVTQFNADRNTLTGITQIPSTFLGNGLVTASSVDSLIALIAQSIEEDAERVVSENNVYHIAFSGGRTPVKLLKKLAESNKMPWQWVHIWQVDERCVQQTDKNSNFFDLHEQLLQIIKIPYFNIHPLPVDVGGRICDTNDRADQMYLDLLSSTIHGARFDLILLGVGIDGHTASLFPGSTALTETSGVAYVLDHSLQYKRMTLTYPVLNNAKKIYVLVTGTEKYQILHDLENSDKTTHPINGVKPVNGNLTWFVDYESLFG